MKQGAPNRSSKALSSKNILLIHLDQVLLEELIEKLLYNIFSQKKTSPGLFKQFIKPVEKALIEFALEQKNYNQIKASTLLGINRNTLKTKITTYGIDISDISARRNQLYFPHSQIFLSTPDAVDIYKATKSWLRISSKKQSFPKTKLFKSFIPVVETRIIEITLSFCKGNKLKASSYLDLNRNVLKKKLDKGQIFLKKDKI